MSVPMDTEMTLHGEAFSTNTTYIGLLSSVNLLMSDEAERH